MLTIARSMNSATVTQGQITVFSLATVFAIAVPNENITGWIRFDPGLTVVVVFDWKFNIFKPNIDPLDRTVNSLGMPSVLGNLRLTGPKCPKLKLQFLKPFAKVLSQS